MSSDTSMSDVKLPLLSPITSLADRGSNKDDLKNDKDNVDSDKDEPKDNTNDMPAKDEDETDK